MAPDQEHRSFLDLTIVASSKDKLLVCIPSLNLIRHNVESIELRQRAWCKRYRMIAFLGVPTHRSHGYDKVFNFQGVLSHFFCFVGIEQSKI